uniref:Ribonuclease A-domain domain-containing protein n=1 Tax=Monopterus albus TaxID=43700 RepID=A0A3Q3ISR4_MONAL
MKQECTKQLASSWQVADHTTYTYSWYSWCQCGAGFAPPHPLLTDKCKDTNTFILSTINLVKEICDRAGPQYKDGDLTTSTKQFDIVVCKLEQKGASPPNCKYNGTHHKSQIVISCEGGFPVHYEKNN